MATYYSQTMSTNNTYIKYRIKLVTNSQNITNNTTNVTASVEVWRTNTGYTSFGTGTCYFTIDGNNYSSSITTSHKFSHNSYTQIYSVTMNITHGSNGDKTLAMSSYISHSVFTSSSQAWSQVLTTIPRASTISSFPNFDINANPSISVDRKSTAFTHTLMLYIGSTKITEEVNVTTSRTFSLTTNNRQAIYNAMGTSNTITATMRCYTYSGTTAIGSYTTATATASKPLATTISYSDFTIGGGNVSVALTRASTTFSHTLVMKIGNTTVLTRANITTTPYTLIISGTEENILYNAMKTVTSSDVVLSCSTFSGAIKIRSDTTLNKKASVATSIVPTLTGVSRVEASVGISAVGAGFIQGLSKITLTITGATGAKFSTITGYQITFDGNTTTTSSTVSPFIKGSGTLTITGRVTDSRGRVSTVFSVGQLVQPYAPPKITAFSIKRCDINGTLNELGTSMKLWRTGEVSSILSKNTLRYTIYSKLRTTSSWGTAIANVITSVGVNTMNGENIFSTYLANTAYDLRMDIEDKFNTTISLLVLSTGEVSMSWGRAGIGVGKIWEKGTLDVGGNAFVDGSVTLDVTSVERSFRWQSGNTTHAYIFGRSDVIGLWDQSRATTPWRYDLVTGEFRMRGLTNRFDNKVILSGLEYDNISGINTDTYGNMIFKSTATDGSNLGIFDRSGTNIARFYGGSETSGNGVRFYRTTFHRGVDGQPAVSMTATNSAGLATNTFLFDSSLNNSGFGTDQFAWTWLQVTGANRTLYIDTTTTSTLNLIISGTVRASGVVLSSSRNHKKDIEDMTSKTFLDKVNATKVYKYRNTEALASANGTLPVAYDQVGEVYPMQMGLMVEESPSEILNEDKDGVELYAMTSMLWKSVQELSAQVVYLENKINRR